MKVFGIAGRSGMGKTTLLERLVPTLVARGLRISLLKHSHKDIELDRPGKDSHRLREAGCQEVLLLGRTRWALMHELRDEAEPTLEDLLTRKGFIYGVRVVPGLYGIQSLLGKLGVTCVEVDLEAVYQTKSETDDIVYSRIRGLQQQFQACFVYIKGLLTVSDGTQQAPHLLLSASCLP